MEYDSSLTNFLPTHFKILKTMLSSWVIRKQAMDCMWPKGHSLPTPGLVETGSHLQRERRGEEGGEKEH